MINKCVLWGVVVVAIGLAGCGKSDSGGGDSSGAGGGGAAVSGMEREAQDAAVAELQRHWVKAADGWITARISGSPYAPDHYIREIRELTVTGVAGNELSDSDKLNGFEWSGEVSFKSAPCREAGDAGLVLEGIANVTVDRPRGQWSQWITFQPDPIHVQKVKGKWEIPQDTWLLRGNIPTGEDFAKAGVK